MLRGPLLVNVILYLLLRINGSKADKEYEINPEYIDLYLHRASTFALFESKAKKELRKLSEADHIIFDQCKKNVGTVLLLAKCVNSVLDRVQSLNNDVAKEASVDNNCGSDSTDGNWITGLIRGIYQKFICKEKGKKSSSNNTNNNNGSNFTMNFSIKKSNPKNVTKTLHKKRFGSIPRLRKLPVVNNSDQMRFWETKKPLRIHKIKKRETNYRRVFQTSKRCNVPKNVDAMRKVKDYFDKMNHVIRFTYRVGKENERYMKKMNEKVSFRSRRSVGDSPYEQMKKMMDKLEEFDDRGVVSILSPKLFNIMPEGEQDPESKRYLSPNMLSFQEEGLLPLPRLFRLSNSDECETMNWLDLMLDFTGGSKMLLSHIDKFGDHMKTVNDVLFPRVQQTESVETHYEKVYSLSTDEQKKEMDKFGYAALNKQQSDLMYGENGLKHDPYLLNTDHDNPDVHLEKVIRSLSNLHEEDFSHLKAQFEHPETFKDSTSENSGKISEMDSGNIPFRTKRQAKRRPSFFDFRDLDPFAITQRIGNPNVLGRYVLSPYAFYLQVFSPTLLNMEIINPRAFIATIFSPVVLVLRVLSPSAFRLMLFSPLMLIGWVLVPEAFLAKIFSPKLLDARILSPESFSAIILSPGAGVARIASPNAMNVLVLSPSLFTYGLYSGNRYVLQVLSPGLVGVDSHPILKPLP